MDQIIANISLLFEFPVANIKIIVDGLMIGALFAVAAYGLALVWGVMNVKNLAQGDFVIAGGYVAWWLAGLGMPPLLGVPVAFVVLGAIGWVVYKLVITRVIERDLFTSLLATFGLAIMIAQILNLLFGSDTQSIQLEYDTLYFFDGFVDIPIAKLLGVLMAAVLARGESLIENAAREPEVERGLVDSRSRCVGSEQHRRRRTVRQGLEHVECRRLGKIVARLPGAGVRHHTCRAVDDDDRRHLGAQVLRLQPIDRGPCEREGKQGQKRAAQEEQNEILQLHPALVALETPGFDPFSQPTAGKIGEQRRCRRIQALAMQVWRDPGR